jgi:hypothetical protein
MKRFEVAGVTYPLPILLGVPKERKKKQRRWRQHYGERKERQE